MSKRKIFYILRMFNIKKIDVFLCYPVSYGMMKFCHWFLTIWKSRVSKEVSHLLFHRRNMHFIRTLRLLVNSRSSGSSV